MIREWISRRKTESAETDLAKLKREFAEVLQESVHLKSQLRTVKDELETLKLKKKIEEEDIKHLTKIKLEQGEIDFTKRTMALEKSKYDEIFRIKQEYADKLHARLEAEAKNIKEMYSEILKRLPDVNVHLKGNV